jgi:hypothetical protein
MQNLVTLLTYIGVVLLGGLMGIIGQGVRTIVGMKKLADQADAQATGQYDLFLAPRLFVSLFIGFIAGAAAALLTLNVDDLKLSATVLMGLAAAGYTGTDFIEGIASRFTGAAGNLKPNREPDAAPVAARPVATEPRAVAPVPAQPLSVGRPRAAALPGTGASEAFDQSVVDACAAITLRDSTDVVSVFAPQGGFFTWYNAVLSNISAFRHRGRATNTPLINQHFTQFWDQIPTTFARPQISMVEFCALMSINIQETTGDLAAAPEEMNGQNRPHPGLAYAFDKIPGLKQSYNQAPNKTAFDLFQDWHFQNQHAALAGSAAILNRPGGIDPAWAGQSWPASYPSTKVDPGVNGFVMEADFYKFRGRGVIQTTWRSDYILLISFILSSQAAGNSALASLAEKWLAAVSGLVGAAQLDVIATISSNADWDLAFAQPITLAAGVAIDSAAKGDYLQVSHDAGVLQGDRTVQGSLLRMASRINGGSYPATVVPMMQSMMIAVAGLNRATAVAVARQPRLIEA